MGILWVADGWVGIETYSKAKEKWLKTFLELPNGIPSQDTFGRVFSELDPEMLEQNFPELDQGDSSRARIEGSQALDLLRQDNSKGSLKMKRYQAGLNNNFLLQIMSNSGIF